MDNHLDRRKFLASVMGTSALTMAGMAFATPSAVATGDLPPFQRSFPAVNGLKTSLNAFCFNASLLAGTMTIHDALDFCAVAGFEGIDITGYYFKGYPQPPADEYLFDIKRKAFGLGIGISGTGVRNDFTISDPAKREQEVKLVKSWIEVAAKLGAPVIRIFAGNQKNEGISKERVTEWMLKDIQTCVDYGKQYGVVIGLQNHNDFIQTADQAVGMIEAIHSVWLGLILDTGSFRVLDPYEEIARAVKHTVNWQIKEKVFINGVETDTDMRKLMEIIRSSGYKGYLPIETLGDGDPKTKALALLAKLQKSMT